MVLRIPETGLQLESSDKIADTLPLQAFAITLSDSVIENLIQCVQDGEDIRLSLGNVPVSELQVNSVVADSVDASGSRWNPLLFDLQDNSRPQMPIPRWKWDQLDPLKSSPANTFHSRNSRFCTGRKFTK